MYKSADLTTPSNYNSITMWYMGFIVLMFMELFQSEVSLLIILENKKYLICKIGVLKILYYYNTSAKNWRITQKIKKNNIFKHGADWLYV